MECQNNYTPEPNIFQLEPPPPDLNLIRAFANLLLKPEDGCIEVRVLGNPTRVGFFDDSEALVQAVLPFNGKAAIYVGLNPREKSLLGTAPNRLVARINGGTTEHVLSRRWLAIDLDPVRPANTSSSQEELDSAIGLQAAIQADLRGRGIAPLQGLSGNGAHLLIPTIAYPTPRIWGGSNDDPFGLILRWLGRRYSTERVKVDSTTFDAP